MIKFEHQWGGEDTWYTKCKMWSRNQRYPLNRISDAIIEWVWKHWVEGRVRIEMASVEKQAEEILKRWEEEDDRYAPEIVERGVFGEEGWSISMSNPVVDRGTKEPKSSMGSTGNEKRLPEELPDPWDDPLM